MESLLNDESSPVWVVRYMSEAETETLIDLCTKKLQSGGESISGSAAEEDGDQGFKHSYRALLLRATAYVKQNKFHLALADYNEMLRYNPENADLLYNRCVFPSRAPPAFRLAIPSRLFAKTDSTTSHRIFCRTNSQGRGLRKGGQD